LADEGGSPMLKIEIELSKLETFHPEEVPALEGLFALGLGICIWKTHRLEWNTMDDRGTM
jgi:hypothetical protein